MLTLCIVIVALAVVGCSTGHRHTYSNKWSYNTTQHWHKATCEHTDMKRDVENHNFSNDKCTVCGYIKNTPVPDPDDGSETDWEFGDNVSRNNANFYEGYSAEEKELYYTLWDENTVINVEIDISAHELQMLNEAYEYWRDHNHDATLADVYRKCNLKITVNGHAYEYEEVGIRMRGNTSRTDFVNNKGQIYNLVHFRFSLTETFDGDEYEGNAWASELYHDWQRDTEAGEAARKKRKDRTFATMEKFYYKWNKNYDQTYIREVYNNRMFQAYGILAPHITLAQFSVKQNNAMENIGVGNLYELIDKQFIKRNFDKAHKGGDLYKCTYVSSPADFTNTNSIGVETAKQSYTYDLKTNDDPTEPEWSNHEYIKTFIGALQTSKTSPEFKTKLESMMDMDYFARFEAVNYLVGNPDCIRNHANNFYLYFTPKDDNGNFKVYLIPYDYDRCFGANMDWNPANSMVNSGPYTTETTIDENGRTCRNPLYTKTILDGGLPEYRAMYTAALKKVLDGKWFTYANYKAIYEAYKTHYATLARPSKTIEDQCGGKLSINKFVFSESGSRDIGDSRSNMEVSYYMELKRQTATNGLDK